MVSAVQVFPSRRGLGQEDRGFGSPWFLSPSRHPDGAPKLGWARSPEGCAGVEWLPSRSVAYVGVSDCGRAAAPSSVNARSFRSSDASPPPAGQSDGGGAFLCVAGTVALGSAMSRSDTPLIAARILRTISTGSARMVA